eukprot:c13920_g1_i1 orf=567-2825(-)
MSEALHFSSGVKFYGERVRAPKQRSPACAGSKRLDEHRRVYCQGRQQGQQGRAKLSDLQHDRRGNKRWPLTDDGPRRIIKERRDWESQLRKNKPGAHAVKWFRRSPSEMARFLADGRTNLRFNKHVDKAICTISKLSSRRRGSYDFGVVMNPWVGSLSFKDMCIILREQKHWVQACDFFQWMKLQGPYIPSVIPYTMLLRICGQAGKFDLVETYYTEMLEAGCEPDEVVICSLICIFGKSGQIDKMMNFYSMMRSQGLVPSIVVSNIMLSSLYKAGLYSDAIDLWKDLLAARVKPNEYTYAVAVNVFRKGEKFVEALQVFEEMMQAGHLPDEILYNMVLKMMGDLGRKDEILDLYERMKVQGLLLSKHTYTYLVHFFSKAGKFQLAVTFFSEMQSRGFPADEVIYGTLITIYSNLGMFVDAEQAFKEMDEAGLVVTGRIFVLMASVRMKAGNFSLALQLFDEMQSRGFEMTKYAWIIVLQCCLKQRKLSHAESAFNIMVNRGFADAVAYTCMFNLYKRMQMFEAGKVLLSKLENSDVEPDEELYGAIIDHFCSAGLLQQAEYYFAEMQMKGLMAGRTVRTILIRAYGKAGRLADAESLYNGLDHADATAICVMFSIYDSFGRKEAAMALSNCLLECDLKSYDKTILKCAKRGAVDMVEFLCSQMLIKGLMPSEDTFLFVIDMFGKKEQCQEAMKLFEQGCKSGLCFSPAIYNLMVDTCIKCGEGEKADLLLRNMETLGLQRDNVNSDMVLET